MAYTEIKERNGSKYYYRVKSKRINNKIKKQRIYIGKNLNTSDRLLFSDKADKKLNEEKIKSNLNKIKPAILKILKKHNIKKAGLFGSYAIGENKKNSDIDIIIEKPKGIGYDFFQIEIDLSKDLNKKFDIITYKGLDPKLKERILNQEIKLI